MTSFHVAKFTIHGFDSALNSSTSRHRILFTQPVDLNNVNQ